MIGVAFQIVMIGLVAGLLFGALLGWGFLRSVRRMSEPPSTLARNVTLLILVAASTLLVGPGFSFIYRILFWRLFGDAALWVFGVVNTLVLGLLVNTYAARQRLRDLHLIVRLNLGAALVLGWLIPLLYLL